LTSNEIKTALYNHFRFKKQYIYIADEVEYSDFLIINKNNIITEIEIKISISDLKADFKKEIHKIIKVDKNIDWVKSNYFYFCVPEEISEKALNIISDEDNRYGLYIIGKSIKTIFKQNIYSVFKKKKAKLLRKNIDEKEINKVKDEICARMSSKIANDMAIKYKIKDQKEI
jgi:hypothetical protein